MLLGVRGMWERSVLADEVGVPPLCKGRCLWRQPQTEGLFRQGLYKPMLRHPADGYNPPASLSLGSPLYTRGP